MTVKRRKYPAGLTFIEIIIATVVLVIAVLGTSAFRYSAALSARKADLQATASRAALLLCESWRGASEPNTFDAAAYFDASLAAHFSESDLNIVNTEQGPYPPDGFTLLDHYKISVDGVSYWATLSWNDVSPGLRALNVAVAWDRRGSVADYFGDADKSFKLTTYVAD